MKHTRNINGSALIAREYFIEHILPGLELHPNYQLPKTKANLISYEEYIAGNFDPDITDKFSPILTIENDFNGNISLSFDAEFDCYLTTDLYNNTTYYTRDYTEAKSHYILAIENKQQMKKPIEESIYHHCTTTKVQSLSQDNE